VLLKVKPEKSSLKLSSCTKLLARFYGPFEILDIIGPVAYMISFHAYMNVHNVFHVSLLKKYVHDPNHVIDWHLIQVETKGEFQFQPVGNRIEGMSSLETTSNLASIRQMGNGFCGTN
jgi:hypothetical protein